ncbi:phage baseplate assembly protein V [Nannocystaceae bacterium ST9]
MDELLERLARTLDRKRWGKYRGFVVDNQDPDKLGRVRVRVPSVYGEQDSDWALPSLPFGGAASHGLSLLPEPNDAVWVEFEEGDIDRPIWVGFFSHSGNALPEPGKRTLKTPAGHRVEFNDLDGAHAIEVAHEGGAKLTIDAKGSIHFVDQAGAKFDLDAQAKEVVVADSGGNSIKLSSAGITLEDANGNKITMDSKGIKFEGSKLVLQADAVELGDSGGEGVIKKSFLDIYASHVHPHPLGPTSTPIPGGESNTASRAVKST